MSGTSTSTTTYTTADVEIAFRRFKADLYMIADSTKSITRSKADEYAHDAEYLAKHGYLKQVDITLFSKGSNGTEEKATVYVVNTSAGTLEAARPGGVLWPPVEEPYLRVILSYTAAYTAEKKQETSPKLKIGWVPSSDDTSHATLKSSGSRDFVSNSYALQRKDFSK